MSTFSFVVEGVPVAQPRPEGGVGRTRFGCVKRTRYVPESHPVHGYRDAVKAQCRLARPAGWDLSAAVVLSVEFVFPPAAGPARRPHRVRPDLDNLLKAVKDAMRLEAYLDDAQVVKVFAAKWHAAACGDRPQTLVVVEAESGL